MAGFSPPQELASPNNNAPYLKKGDAREGGLGETGGGGGGIDSTTPSCRRTSGKGSGPPLHEAAGYTAAGSARPGWGRAGWNAAG